MTQTEYEGSAATRDPWTLLSFVCLAVGAEATLFTVLPPLVPHYEQSLRMSSKAIGVLSATYAAGGFVAAVPGGTFASRYRAKMTALLGLALMALLAATFGFAPSAWLLDVTRFGQGVGAALVWTGALGWLTAESPRERRGEMIGYVIGAAAIGALAGPAVGAVAAAVGTQLTFLAFAASCGFLTAWGLRLGQATSEAPAFNRTSMSMLLRTTRDSRILTGIWLLALPSLSFGLLSVLAPLRLSRLGYSAAAIGIIFMSAALLEGGVSVLVGRWTDRIGRFVPLCIGLALSCVALAVYPVGQDRLLVAFLVLANLIAAGALFAPATAFLSDESERAGLLQTDGFVLLNLAWAPGNLVGALGAGVVAGVTSEYAPSLALSAIFLVSVGMILLQENRRRRKAFTPPGERRAVRARAPE